MQYVEQTFNLPELRGLSARQIEAHVKLYAGYVKNTNAILALIDELKENSEKNAIALSEVKRRFSFEFNGMRLHELYFEGLGGKGMSEELGGKLHDALAKQWGSFEAWHAEFTAMGMMRGIGWVLLAYDAKADMFHNVWVNDHEVGHLGGLPILLALDVWEHAFLLDYVPAERGKYLAAFFDNLLWEVCEARFSAIRV
ncbi:MAG: superoxide dismutase [Candidatus Uhrbacteria bacterium]|nr:superoxide dismutase [Candidatus Uhrbacteria bacterium]